jgi:tetratricopeptide (TPR) repeat protein
VFFNGKESLKQASKKVEAIEPQNFDEILPVFAFEYEQAAGLVAGDMQRTIDKGTKTIEKHSITAKPKRKKNMTKEQKEFYNKKEFNRFVDDAHFIIGKANAYMHEYDMAEEKFAFISSEYPKEMSVYESQVWQSIALAWNKEYVKAEDLLMSLVRKKSTPRKIEPLLNEAFADLYLKQNKYAEAIPYLEKALKKARGKNKKIRYNYILGQLYQKTGNNAKATYHFSKVLRKNPPYFTAFNAEMSMAYAYDPTKQKGNMRKILEKALRNSQNDNYHDQIYYAFAKLEESEGNIPASLEYYHKSITATGINTRQKGLSYLALAEYYIKQPDYVRAYTYYDSSAIMLGADHSQYEKAAANATKYRKLALNMKIVEREDSLQKLSGLSKEELDNFINQRIKQAEDEKKKTEEEKARLDRLKSDIDESSKGQWYFYNPTSLELGRTDFNMRWGQRKLEDNWRRKNKGMQIQQEYDTDLPEAEIAAIEQKDTIDRQTLAANIPTTDEAKKASNEKIASAMLNIGEAFRDDINDLNKAAETLEMLNQRFPSHGFQAESYVALYDIYNKLGDTGKATYYKTLMLRNYPANPKVLAATDPNYVNKMQTLEYSEEAEYNMALNLYTSNRLADTYRAAENGLNKYPKGRLAPQFTLLKTLSDNYNGNVVRYRSALKELIDKFPGNEAAVYAQNVLTELEKFELKQELVPETVPDDKPQLSIQSPYSVEDGAHSFVVIADASVNVNRLRFNILSFNAANFLENNYEVQIVDFAKNKMLIMNKIKDRITAMDYYNKIIEDPKVFKDISINDYVMFVILDSNLALIRSGTSFLNYVDFFNKAYLK